MSKTYNIKSVQDMIDCTNSENIDNFLKDLKSLLETAHTFQDLVDTVAESENISKNLNKLRSEGFTWIDDGKNDISIKIETI